ncbi:MAG: translation initiation factor IF-2 [Bdellovibrionales bacterium GWB1_55_8]|nr:MAG: translation initiation factor IF-2 [Bdellovibrionales bacterium GWB1_55_8]
MSEQENLKVYELAKELGVDSISLLDKLKALNIQVKNHMSELGAEDVQVARNALGKKSEGDAKGTKKKTVTRKKKAAAEPVAPEPEVAAGEKKAAAPVIRRRTKADGMTETVAPTTHTRTVEAREARTHEAETEHHEEETSAAEAEASLAHQTEAQGVQEQEELQGEVSQPVEEMAAAPSEAEAPVEEPVAKTEAIEAPIAATPAEPTAKAQPPAPEKPVRPPVVLTPRPVAPRRSILKIVEATSSLPGPTIIKPAPAPAPAPKASVKGTTTQDKDGFRIIKMTKENLDQMVEEEAAKKRGGGAREKEIRPEDVRFADYRKKEMVFLPKKKKVPVGKEIRRTQVTQAKAQKRIVEMGEAISVSDLANQLSVKATDVIRKLMGMGQMATINASLDFDTATLIATEYQYEVRNIAFKEDEVLSKGEDTAEQMQARPPIVTIMGHVDHGKTTLLDSIREANVAAGEAGGITQHIGAYTVEKNGKLITFIDTPGHEAFTVMRARGANVTDIVILVVSADDGVMPQTREAVSHAQAAKVPIIVAVNKIDKPGANPEKVKQELADLNLLAEDWGGETMFVPVSALKKTNIDKLLDSILLQSEVLELKANPDTRASGTVLESRLEKGRGPVVSLLVNRGTLAVGDALVSGQFAGKVKAMTDHKGKTVKTATPGIAVEVLGFEGVPNAGEKFDAPPTESDARSIAQNRIDKAREKAGATNKVSLEDLFAKIQAGDVKELSIILKADVFGSVEAIRDSLTKLSNEKVKVKVIHSAPGGITESDVLLATASNAIIIGFNVRPETKARQIAESEHIEIKCYSIIYELIDEVKNAMVGLLDKKKVEKFLGRAEVRQTFSVPKIGVIAGSAVIDGKIVRGANVRLLRDSRVIFEGKMSSLRRFKDDAKEVATGYECGIGIENYSDLKPGDVIEAYQIEMIAGTFDA